MDIEKLLSWGNAYTGQTTHEAMAQDATLRNQQALINAAQSSKFAQMQAERQAVVTRQQQLKQHYDQQADWWIKPSDIAVNQSGFGGVMANAANTGLAALDGATHLVGQGFGAIFQNDANLQSIMVPDEVKLAHGRYQAGKATPADMELLSKSAPITAQRLLPRSYMEMMDDITATQANAGKFYGDKSKGKPGLLDTDTHNEYHRDARAAQLKKLNDAVDAKYLGKDYAKLSSAEKSERLAALGTRAFDYMKEVGGNAFDASMDHKWSLASDLAESVPYMLGGPMGVAAGAAAQTLEDNYHSTNQYKKREGHLPTATDQLKMTGVSAANFGLNYLENILPVKAVGLGKEAAKANLKTASGLATETTKLSTEAAIKQLKGLAGKTAAVAVATGAEGIAEGLQTGIQSGWGALEKASLREITEAGVQGGLVGGAATAGGYSLGYAAEASQAASDLASQSLEKLKEDRAAKKDYDTLINPESKHFNPAEAVNTQVAAYYDENATEEQKTQAKTKMDEAIKVAEETYTQREEELTTSLERTRELADPIRDELTAMQEALDNTTDPDEIAEIKADMKEAQAELKQFEKSIKTSEAELQKIQESRQAVYDARDRFDDQESAVSGDIDTPEAVQKTVDTLKSTDPVDPADLTKAVAKFKKNPMLAKPEDMIAIVENESNGLSPEERASIRKLAEAQIALNKHKDNNTVSREIIEGGKFFRGLNEYNREVAKALGSDRVQQADRFLKELDNFKAHATDKLNVAQQALKESENLLKNWKAKNPDMEPPHGVAQLQIYKDQKNGKWKINRGEVEINDDNRADYGALYINAAAPKSRALVPQIKEDVVQIVNAQNALVSMRKAYKPTGKGNATTPNKKKASGGQSTEPTSSQTPIDPQPQQAGVQGNAPAQPTLNINAGQGENAHLSNFAKRKFSVNGQKFYSVEQAFHFAKAKAVDRDDIAQQVLKTFKGGELRKLTNAQNMKLDKEQRAKWDGMSESVMYKLMKASFEQDATARQALLDTGDAVLTHQYKGKEMDNGRFSRVLTKIREELKQNTSQDAQNASDSHETNKPMQSLTVDPKEAENALQRKSEEATGAGRLSLFEGVDKKARQAEREKSFREQNLVKATFVQKLGKGFLNPLVEIKDFISNIRAVANPEQYLKDYYKKGLDEAQLKHFQNFVEYTDQFAKDLGKVFIYNAEHPDWHFTDYMQFLAQPQKDGSVQFDENLVSAMAHSAFTWTAENGNTPWAKDEDILENVFHFDNTEAMYATPEIRREFRLSTSFTALASEIGAKAVQALGLRIDPEHEQDLDATRKFRLESSIGGYIVHAMQRQGILQVRAYTDAQMAGFARELGETRYNEYLSNQLGIKVEGSRESWDEATLDAVKAFEKSTKVNQKFVALVRDKKGEAPKYVQSIMESAKGTKGFLSELFGVQSYNRAPMTVKPEGFKQDKIKNTTAGVPSVQAELLDKAQQHEQRIRTETFDPIAHIFTNHQAEALHLFDLRTDEAWIEKNYHVKERESVIAKRQGVLRNLDLALEFANDYLERDGNEFQGFYTEFEVWMPQRMGVTNNMMNTQSNTVHRALATPADYKMTLTAPAVADGANRGEAILDAAFDDNGNVTSLGRLLRAIAEGAEDMKGVEGIPSNYLQKKFDKVDPDDYLPSFVAWMEKPEVQAAINAVSKLRKLSADKQPVPKEVFRDIKPVLDKMGGGFMEFNSLIALSELYDAINEGGKEFTTYMRAGSDGVTSGSAISHLATATVDASTGSNEMAHGFGMITHDAHDNMGVDDIFDLHAQGNKDIYQTLNKFQNDRWYQVFSGQSGLMSNEFVNYLLNDLFQGMNDLYKDFNDRSKGKASATPTIYGSGSDAIKANVADKAVAKIYEHMRDLHHLAKTNPEEAAQKAEKFNDALNSILQYYNWMMVPASDKTYMNTPYKDENGKKVSALDYFGPKMEADHNMNFPDDPISFAEMDTRTFLTAYSKRAKAEEASDNQLWYAAIQKFNSTRVGNKGVKYLAPDFLHPRNDLLNLELPKDIEAAIFKTAYHTHGKVHELGLKDAYQEYLDIRNVDVAIIDVGFTIYNEIREQLLKEALDRAMDPDAPGPKVAFRVDKKTGEKIPLENLPPRVMAEIDKQLYNIRPLLASAMSTQSKDPLGTGLMMAKQTERFLSDTQHNISIRANTADGPKSSQLGTRDRTLANPGVLGAVIPVLSTDARVAANTLGLDFATEDMHDSNYSNPDKAGEMGKFQNKQLHDSISTYHMQVEKLNVMMRALEAWTSGKFVLDDAANQRIIQRLGNVSSKFYKDIPPMFRPSLDKMIPELVNNRYEMELRKLDQFDKYYAIHHYGAEGGQYVLSEADAKLRAEERAKLEKEVGKGGRASQRAKTVASGLSKIIDTGKQRVRKDVEAEQEAAKAVNSTAKFLEGKRDKPFRAGQLIGHLKKEVKSQAGKQLLDVIEKLLPEDTTVNYFNDQKVPEHVDMEGLDEASAAWFDPNTNQINILDTESESGKVSAETALHELLHAATSHAITMVENGKGTAQMKEAVARLEELRQELLAHPESKKFANELSDVHELIAYGLSNKDFQKFLQATPVKRGKRKLTTMFRDFVSNMLDLVFGIEQRSNHRKQIPAFEALVVEFGNLAEGVMSDKDALAKEVSEIKQAFNPMINAQRAAQGRVDAMRTTEVFEALDGGNTSPEYNLRALGLIESVVDSVMNRVGRKSIMEAMYKETAHANNARNAGFALSDREAFLVEALEATLETALDNGAGSNIYKVLTSVHDEARKTLTPSAFFEGDWVHATAQDKALAQAKYDYLFKAQSTGGKSNTLARFAALAMGSEAIYNKLGYSVPEKPKADKGLMGKVADAVDAAIAWVMNWMAGVKHTDKLNQKVQDLTERMAMIDTKFRVSAVRKFELMYYRLMSGFGKASTLSGAILNKFAQSEKTSKSNNRFVRTLGIAARVAVSDQQDKIQEFFKDMRDHDNPNTRYGAIAESLREFEGAEGFTKYVHKLFRATKMIEATRTEKKEAVMRTVKGAFETKLTEAQNKAMSYGLLRSGAHVLFGDFTAAEIRNLVGQKDTRKKAIDDLTDRIKSHRDYRSRMLIRAKQLGWYTQSENPTPGLVLNALAIVQGVGSPSFKGELQAADPDLVKMIDQLSTLYAFEYMTEGNRKELQNIMTLELRRRGVKSNGIEYLLGLHGSIVKEAEQSLFADNPLSMIKGWMPDISNPYVKVQNFPMSQRADLEKKGWVFVAPVKTDAADYNQGSYGMFKWDNVGNTRRVSGAMSLTDTHKKGTVITNGADGDFTGTVQANLKDLVRKNEFIDPDKYDPRKDMSTQLFANFDTEGNVMNYSYRMNAHTRDSLLERGHNVAELLGEYVGSMYDKLHSPEQNRKVIEALHEDFKTNYAKKPNAYVAIGPRVTDPGAQELWRLLPYQTRKDMEQIWGKGKPMYVRNDLVSTVFGHKKIALGNLWNKAKDERHAIEKVYAFMMEGIFKDKAQLRSNQIGTAWAEMVKEAKDWIVLRTGGVLIGNLKFNTVLLTAYGISPTAIIRDSMVAFRAGKAYREDMRELMDIESQLRSGTGNQAELEHRYAQLQDSLARNPLREFIESGTMPTIVDDVEINKDDYSYKSVAGKKLQKFTNVVPEGLRTAGRTAIMSPGTVGHNFMSAATQYSDFVARYVVYNHARKREGMSHDDAVQEAMQMFIQYDLPSSPQVQWLNDVGLIMFTKFLFRFQHVMMKVLRKNPAFVMSQTFLLHMLSDTEAVLDPNLINKAPGMFYPGALTLPSAIGGSTPMSLVF